MEFAEFEDFLCQCSLTQARGGHTVRVWLKAQACCRGWQKEERGREEEEARERDQERVSHHYCHSVTHSGHSVSPSVCAGPGRLAGDTLPLLPSIHLSLFQLIHTSTFSLSFTVACFICLCQGDCVMLSSSLLSITAIPASPVILVLAWGSGMSSFLFQPSPHPVPGSRTRSSSCSEEQWKSLTSDRNHSLMNDWRANADSSHRGKNQYVDLKHNKIYICRAEQRDAHRLPRLQITLQWCFQSLCAMKSFQFSVFHNLLAAEIAR